MTMTSGLSNRMRESIKKVFHWLKLDIKRYNEHNSEELLLQKILRNFGIKTVLDVGANQGQYAQGLIDHGYNGKIYSFEPITSVFEVLNKNSAGNPLWAVFNLGLGAKDEELMINISENLVSSSILKVSKTSTDSEPKTRITHGEKVRLSTLDALFAKQPAWDSEILLKLDVQGYELEALRGAVKSLSQIKVVQAEMSFVQLYEGAPLYGEVVDFLKGNGFDIFTIIPGFRNGKTGQLLQADGIFVRP